MTPVFKTGRSNGSRFVFVYRSRRRREDRAHFILIKLSEE